MGQDVDRTLFSRRDRQTYRSKVQRCLDALTLMLREHPFAHDEPMTGVEVELHLVDDDELAPAWRARPPPAPGEPMTGVEVELNLVDDDELVPALRGPQVLAALRGADFQP